MQSQRREALIRYFESVPKRTLSREGTGIVLDTNVVLDRWVFCDARAAFLTDVLRPSQYESIGHLETFLELADVIARPQFGLSEKDRQDLLNRWLKETVFCESPLEAVRFCKDPDDDKFFNLACKAGAAYLVSKDKRVHKARAKALKRGVAVITLAQAQSIFSLTR